MDIKKHFQELIKQDKYSFNEFLSVFNSFTKMKDKEDLVKYLFGPGRDSQYIPKLSNTNEINLFFNILLTKENNPSLSMIQEKLEKQINYVLPAIKSHTGRLINPSTKMSLLKIEKDEKINNFFNGDSFEQRRFSYAGNAAYQGERFLLEGHFYYNDQLTGFLELIINNDVLLHSYPYYNDIVSLLDNIRNETEKYSSVEVADELPQTFFPLENGNYLALTILPSFSLLNQMKTTLTTFKSKNYNTPDPHFSNYNKTISMKIGGTQTQNVASFNSDNAGVYEMLENTSPKIIVKKKIIDEKIFYGKSLIRYTNPKLKLNENFDKFSYDNRQSHIRTLVEIFLKHKLETLFNIIEFYDENDKYKILLENSNIHELEKEYIKTRSKNDGIFTYFDKILRKKFNNSFTKVETENFFHDSQTMFKQVLGEML